MAEVDSVFLGLRRVFFGKLLEVPKPEDEEKIRGDFFPPIIYICLLLDSLLNLKRASTNNST